MVLAGNKEFPKRMDCDPVLKKDFKWTNKHLFLHRQMKFWEALDSKLKSRKNSFTVRTLSQAKDVQSNVFNCEVNIYIEPSSQHTNSYFCISSRAGCYKLKCECKVIFFLGR